ncbi:tonB-system energizer ExbB [Aquabacter sp. L1I39]|nr:tonB-system energizer ExbB [Aquabacter sp. L1I39]
MPVQAAPTAAAPAPATQAQPVAPPGGPAAHFHAAPPPPSAVQALPPTDAAAAPVPGAVAPTGTPTAAPAPALGMSMATPPDHPPALLPHDLSPWGMFMAAALVVQIVMVGLALASVATWTVWLVKSVELAMGKAKVRGLLRALRGATSLDGVLRALPAGRTDPAATLVRSAAAELEASRALPADGVKERVAISLNRIEAAAARRMMTGTGILATIGATAPFIGLFGTVWGIMNSFIGISKAQTTNLAVVAPGIAEALLATAIGLVAAIPAVVIYNIFARAIAGYKAELSDTSAEVMRHLSRDLDRAQARHVSHLRAAAE